MMKWSARQVAVLGLSLVVVAVAIIGWWRVASLTEDLEQARSAALSQRENVGRLTDEFERIRDELVATENRLQRTQGRFQRRKIEVRQMQDCIQLVADRDSAGTENVRFGFIEPFDSSHELRFDEAEWFVGEEARRAARADGKAEVLDYYIRNATQKRVLLPVASEAVVVTTTMDRHNIPAPKCNTWGGFVTAALDSSEPWRSRIVNSPYWVTIEDGYVVRLLEQYLP